MTWINGKPACDMTETCRDEPRWIGDKGFIYCAYHQAMRNQWEPVRQMTDYEWMLVRANQPVPFFHMPTHAARKPS